MRNIIPNKTLVRRWYILTRLVYTTNFEMISEPIPDMNELQHSAEE